MKERPILFSAPMVRAILEGRKTQTRRIIKPQPVSHEAAESGDVVFYGNVLNRVSESRGRNKAAMGLLNANTLQCPYGVPGDRLWVRETHITGWPCDGGDLQQYDEDGNELPMHAWYRATPEPDGSFISSQGERICSWIDEHERHCDRIPWKPSIHMPRWASRITLEVVSVRVERLQEIGEAGACCEGTTAGDMVGVDIDIDGATLATAYRRAFRRLWESINGEGSWAANPWVWVVQFERVKP